MGYLEQLLRGGIEQGKENISGIGDLMKLIMQGKADKTGKLKEYEASQEEGRRRTAESMGGFVRPIAETPQDPQYFDEESRRVMEELEARRSGMAETPQVPQEPVQEPAQSMFVWQTQDKQPFPQPWDNFVTDSAETQGVDPNILASVLANESGGGWDVNGEGDEGTTFGLGQININDFYESAGFDSPQEYKEALRDPAFAIEETARVLRQKIDTFGEGDVFLGVIRYNGEGPDALQYAKEVFNRIGYPIPEEYR